MIIKNAGFKNDYKYLIFDFDGTINNTAPGIVSTFKKVLDVYGIDYADVDFNRHIGPPLEFSFRELVGGENWREALDLYRKTFEKDNAVRNSFIYEGIMETLTALKNKGTYRLSVATSKYEPFAVESLEFLGIKDMFDCLYGQTSKRGFKNEILSQLILDNGWDKEKCLMIGDTCYDIDGARDNGVDVLAVSYGFEKREKLLSASPDAIVDTAYEIAEILIGGQNAKEGQL